MMQLEQQIPRSWRGGWFFFFFYLFLSGGLFLLFFFFVVFFFSCGLFSFVLRRDVNFFSSLFFLYFYFLFLFHGREENEGGREPTILPLLFLLVSSVVKVVLSVCPESRHSPPKEKATLGGMGREGEWSRQEKEQEKEEGTYKMVEWKNRLKRRKE